MIRYRDAIAQARSLIGTPYAKMDCIALIRAIIRRSPGGVPDYRCEGTNWLWDSVNNSAKYRHLTERHEGLAGIPAGALSFKRYGADGEDHVGIATGAGTIVHSSSVGGRGVVETPLTAREGWDCWAKHKNIETAAEAAEEDGMDTMYNAIVITQKDPLRVREAPKTGRILGHVPKGKTVQVLEDVGDEWPRIRFGELEGYASGAYLERVTDMPEPEEMDADLLAGEAEFRLVVRDEAGNVFRPVGRMTVDIEAVVDGETVTEGESVD